MPKGQWPRGVTPRMRSGTAAESSRLPRRRNSQEELPHVQGQGWQPGRATPCPSSVVVAGRSYPPPEARGSGLEEQPNVQGVVAVRAQEGLEELRHIQG